MQRSVTTKLIRPHRNTAWGVLATLSWVMLAHGTPTSASTTDRLISTVEAARAQCAPKIHFDTFSFNRCINQLAANYKKDDLARLGTEYAGFAVALTTMRVGMTGAEDSARYFYWRYRPLQKKLNVSDQRLCATLPGDCTIRIAQTKEFSKTTRLNKPAESNAARDAHDH